MKSQNYEDYSLNCKNCSNLSHFPGETYLSSSSGKRYPKYHCIAKDYIFNSRNVPLQKPCEAFTPTLWCLIKNAIKKMFNRENKNKYKINIVIMKTTREKIKIMQAYEEGEQIQMSEHDKNEWTDMKIEPLWDWVNFDYRIKPKFKDGDILFVTSLNSWIFIYKESENKRYIYKYVAVPICTFDTSIYINDAKLCDKEYISEIRFATEEEKQKLFDILKENNYHWNAETKTLEKLVGPKFKVGDVVQHDDYKVRITEVNTDDNLYGYESLLDLGIGSIPFSKQDCWELAPNKFDLNDLKPFANRVLVRNADGESWISALYVSSDPKSKGCYALIYRDQCIPYKGNEYLSGKTNNCDDFYKTWE